MIDSAPVSRACGKPCAWTTVVLGLILFGGCSPKGDDDLAQRPEPPTPIVVDDDAEKTQEPAPPEDKIPDRDETVAKPAENPNVAPVEAPDDKALAKKPEQTSASDPPSTAETEKPVPAMVQDPPLHKDMPSKPAPAAPTTPPETTPPPKKRTPPKKPTLPEYWVDKIHEPVVVMSKAHEDSCLVRVGDQMPDMTLSDMNGEQHVLSDLYGQTLTVVVLWSRRQALGRDQFRRLGRETWRPFQESGVNVIAVNTGDSVEDVRPLIESADATFPCLFDVDGNAMAALATGKLPRTYLLDSTGKILWLDIEYSRGSRRELENTLYFFLLREDG